MHEVLVNRLGGLSQPRKSVVRLTDRPDMTLDVYRGRNTTTTIQIQAWSNDVQRIRTISPPTFIIKELCPFENFDMENMPAQ